MNQQAKPNKNHAIYVLTSALLLQNLGALFVLVIGVPHWVAAILAVYCAVAVLLIGTSFMAKAGKAVPLPIAIFYILVSPGLLAVFIWRTATGQTRVARK